MSVVLQIDSDTKLCKDCKHCSDYNAIDSWRCRAPINFEGISLVDGSKVAVYEFCVDSRANKNGCGLDGRWFEPGATIGMTEYSKTGSKSVTEQPYKVIEKKLPTTKKKTFSLDDF